MQSGVYDVTIEAPGFDKLLQNGVRLTLGESLRLDGTLPPRDPRDRNPGANGCQ